MTMEGVWMDQPNPTYHHRFRLTEERSDDGRSIVDHQYNPPSSEERSDDGRSIVDHQYNPPSSLSTDRMEGV